MTSNLRSQLRLAPRIKPPTPERRINFPPLVRFPRRLPLLELRPERLEIRLRRIASHALKERDTVPIEFAREDAMRRRGT